MTVYPADVVLFEGILAFYSQEVRDLFQMKLFVDTDADTRLSRRGTVGPTLPSGFTPSSDALLPSRNSALPVVSGPALPAVRPHLFHNLSPPSPTHPS